MVQTFNMKKKQKKKRMNAHGLDPDPYSILGRIQDPDPPLK